MFSRPLTISPQETEIPLLLSTKSVPFDDNDPHFRVCDLSFPLSPALQFSNCKWLIGLKGLTLPTRIRNIDSSFKLFILAQSQIIEVELSDTRQLTAKQITDFLNGEVASKTSFGANIKFAVTNNLVTCQLTPPSGMTSFAVSFSKNLAGLLGFNFETTIYGTTPPSAPAKAIKFCDPYADFKLIDVKCSNADGFSTSQAQPADEPYPEPSLALVQICGNYPVDEKSVAPSFLANYPVGLYTVTIPIESVVFYPISAQTLFSVNIKLLSQSSQLLQIDTSQPIVLNVILRKADHSFV